MFKNDLVFSIMQPKEKVEKYYTSIMDYMENNIFSIVLTKCERPNSL